MHAFYHHCHETTAYVMMSTTHQLLLVAPAAQAGPCLRPRMQGASQARMYSIIANYDQINRDQEQPKDRTSKSCPRRGKQPHDDDTHWLHTNTRCMSIENAR
jgi:hypothetical protein